MKIKTVICFFLVLFTIKLNAQYFNLSSSENIIHKAKGVVTFNRAFKKTYFYFNVRKESYVDNNNKILFGEIRVSDGKNPYTSDNISVYKIYSIKLKDDGSYYYWTIDVGEDGQTVLFVVNKNSITPEITEFRYTPLKDSNEVLKTIEYILD